LASRLSKAYWQESVEWLSLLTWVPDEIRRPRRVSRARIPETGGGDGFSGVVVVAMPCNEVVEVGGITSSTPS